MLGVIALFVFMGLGVAVCWRVFDRLGAQARLMLGCALGMAELMWLPSLIAFLTGFTALAQLVALGMSALLAAFAQLLPRRRRDPAPPPSEPPIMLTLALVVPFFLLSCYLQHTHVLMSENGALMAGQSTYGDLCLHLGIATGLRGASYPPQYTILPGTLLGYPFLFDALSASMMLLGAPLRLAFVVPGAIAMGLVFWAFVLLAWEMTHNSHAVVIAFLLTFLNGGLGFLYVLDLYPSNPGALREMMTGFYQTPTNMPEINLRWVNVICDLMVPQRTLLAGWMMVIPALYLVARAIASEDRFYFLALGIWAGLMPMIHTHSFLALGLISLGAAVWGFAGARNKKKFLLNFLIYGSLAAGLALPQLLTWTFPQTMGGGVLRVWFNWVNHTKDGFIDGYFWFWIKNVGPVFLLLIPSALSAPKRVRPLCFGALVVFTVAELILFQQNEYDNNKLFTVAFILMTPVVGRFLSGLWDKMHGVRGRALLGACFMAVCLTSGAMTLAREVVSKYELFGPGEVKAAEYIEANAFEDAVFLTGGQHTNAVAALTGRRLVCGTGTYLFFHGVDYQKPSEDARSMFEAPGESKALFDEYLVDYIYISNHEKAQYTLSEAALGASYPVWYEAGGVKILAVSGRARAQLPN